MVLGAVSFVQLSSYWKLLIPKHTQKKTPERSSRQHQVKNILTETATLNP